MNPMSWRMRIILVVLAVVTAGPMLLGDVGNIRRFFTDMFASAGTIADPVVKAGPMDQLDIVSGGKTHRFTVEIADTDAKRAEGLMFRKSMAADHGMLFDFKREQLAGFWMKNTYIPLDMVFINREGTVAHIAENAVPLSEANISSEVPVRFVLEVNAGVVRQLGLKTGDRIIHALIRPVAG